MSTLMPSFLSLSGTSSSSRARSLARSRLASVLPVASASPAAFPGSSRTRWRRSRRPGSRQPVGLVVNGHADGFHGPLHWVMVLYSCGYSVLRGRGPFNLRLTVLSVPLPLDRVPMVARFPGRHDLGWRRRCRGEESASCRVGSASTGSPLLTESVWPRPLSGSARSFPSLVLVLFPSSPRPTFPAACSSRPARCHGAIQAVAVKQDCHCGGLVPMHSGNRPHAGIWPSPSVRPPYQTSP